MKQPQHLDPSGDLLTGVEEIPQLEKPNPDNDPVLIELTPQQNPPSKVRSFIERSFFERLLQDTQDFPNSSQRQRSKRLGINQRTVCLALKKINNPYICNRNRTLLQRKLSFEKLRQDIQDFPNSTCSQRAIRLGVVHSTVVKALKKLGISLVHHNLKKALVRRKGLLEKLRQDIQDFSDSSVRQRAQRLGVKQKIIWSLLKEINGPPIDNRNKTLSQKRLPLNKLLQDFHDHPNSTQSQQAQRLGVHIATIRNATKRLRDSHIRNGINPPFKTRIARLDPKKLLQDFQNFPNSTPSQRAQRLGVHQSTILRVSKELKDSPIYNEDQPPLKTRIAKFDSEKLRQDIQNFPNSTPSQRAQRLRVHIATIRRASKKIGVSITTFYTISEKVSTPCVSNADRAPSQSSGLPGTLLSCSDSHNLLPRNNPSSPIEQPTNENLNHTIDENSAKSDFSDNEQVVLVDEVWELLLSEPGAISPVSGPVQGRSCDELGSIDGVASSFSGNELENISDMELDLSSYAWGDLDKKYGESLLSEALSSVEDSAQEASCSKQDSPVVGTAPSSSEIIPPGSKDYRVTEQPIDKPTTATLDLDEGPLVLTSLVGNLAQSDFRGDEPESTDGTELNFGELDDECWEFSENLDARDWDSLMLESMPAAEGSLQEWSCDKLSSPVMALSPSRITPPSSKGYPEQPVDKLTTAIVVLEEEGPPTSPAGNSIQPAPSDNELESPSPWNWEYWFKTESDSY